MDRLGLDCSRAGATGSSSINQIALFHGSTDQTPKAPTGSGSRSADSPRKGPWAAARSGADRGDEASRHSKKCSGDASTVFSKAGNIPESLSLAPSTVHYRCEDRVWQFDAAYAE